MEKGENLEQKSKSIKEKSWVEKDLYLKLTILRLKGVIFFFFKQLCTKNSFKSKILREKKHFERKTENCEEKKVTRYEEKYWEFWG